MDMNTENITQRLLGRYDGLVLTESWGETGFFYNPGFLLPRGVYFATLKGKDGENDAASNLNREGVFRFNFGLVKPRFEELLGDMPARPPKGKSIKGPWDFTVFDRLIPHPVYGWMGWACVLNPTVATFETLIPDLDLTFDAVRRKFEKRIER